MKRSFDYFDEMEYWENKLSRDKEKRKVMLEALPDDETGDLDLVAELNGERD